jgi:hypothetical protein
MGRWPSTGYHWAVAPDVPFFAEPAPMSLNRDGWVYAVCDDQAPLVKIGCTRKHVRHRLQPLAAFYHASLILVGLVYVPSSVFKIEHSIHASLAAQCIENEWFYIHMNQAMLVSLVNMAIGILRKKARDCRSAPA